MTQDAFQIRMIAIDRLHYHDALIAEQVAKVEAKEKALRTRVWGMELEEERYRLIRLHAARQEAAWVYTHDEKFDSWVEFRMKKIGNQMEVLRGVVFDLLGIINEEMSLSKKNLDELSSRKDEVEFFIGAVRKMRVQLVLSKKEGR